MQRQRALQRARAPRRRDALAPARADMLVGAQQVDGAGLRVVAAAIRPSPSTSVRAPGSRARFAARSAAPASAPDLRRLAAAPAPQPRACSPSNTQRGEAPPPSSRSSQPSRPSHAQRRIGAARAGHHARRRNVSTSGVFSGESCSVAGTDSRPLLTSVRANGVVASPARSTASRNSRLISLLGVMKSVARVEWRMFSSAAYSRSPA